eukprot:TRINITY_DN93210_c0_g1_i1.p4 TRINITY_DN93210_c0_g1~~TRINITY_DN93210_c0_g1_i1.p4  ORF type:complete len:107 (-),score=41.08 TRINITY_DN93210_c0_g1_i1:9-329(-)
MLEQHTLALQKKYQEDLDQKLQLQARMLTGNPQPPTDGDVTPDGHTDNEANNSKRTDGKDQNTDAEHLQKMARFAMEDGLLGDITEDQLERALAAGGDLEEALQLL